MLEENINESWHTETKPTRKASKPILLVGGVLATLLILGFVASWLLLHTSTVGNVLLQQHLSRRFHAVWSPDKKQVILFGQHTNPHQTDVYVWDITTNKVTKTLSFRDGDAQTFESTAMSPGEYISQAKDNLLNVWDVRTGRAVITYTSPMTLASVAWWADRYIAAIDRAGTVRIWNIETGAATTSFATGLRPDNSTVTTLNVSTKINWSFDSKHLLISHDGSPIQIWDTFTGSKIQSIQENALVDVNWLDPTRILVSNSFLSHSDPNADASVRVWDALTGRKLLTYTGNTTVPFGSYSFDDRRVVSDGMRETLLWDSTTGKTLLRIPRGALSDNPSLSYDGKFVEANNNLDMVQLWDATTGKRVANYHVESGLLTGSSKGGHLGWFNTKNLISVKETGEVRIFDAWTGQVRYSFDLHTTDVPLLSWSPDLKKIAVSLSNGTVEILQGIG